MRQGTSCPVGGSSIDMLVQPLPDSGARAEADSGARVAMYVTVVVTVALQGESAVVNTGVWSSLMHMPAMVPSGRFPEIVSGVLRQDCGMAPSFFGGHHLSSQCIPTPDPLPDGSQEGLSCSRAWVELASPRGRVWGSTNGNIH